MNENVYLSWVLGIVALIGWGLYGYERQKNSILLKKVEALENKIARMERTQSQIIKDTIHEIGKKIADEQWALAVEEKLNLRYTKLDEETKAELEQEDDDELS